MTKPFGLIRRAFRYMTRGLATFVRMIRDDAEFDANGFYLCHSCGYAHCKGSGCSHTRSTGE